MKIILVKDIEKLGKAGDILTVKDGYSRNYLLPQKLAIVANKFNTTKIENIKKEADAEKLALENAYAALVAKINGIELTFSRKTDENGHLFGSVSENHIVAALAEQEIEINKTNVKMEKHLKEIGSFDVKIGFTSEIFAEIKVNIESE
jgi:large subunit ribosomal protein L9